MLMADLAVMQEVTTHLGAGSVAGRFFVVLILVAVNAFFFAAEFALVAVRRSRIDELAFGGDSKARTVQAALDHLDRYIAGTQLGMAEIPLGANATVDNAEVGTMNANAKAITGINPHSSHVNVTRVNTASAATFGAEAKNAVTGVGAPS